MLEIYLAKEAEVQAGTNRNNTTNQVRKCKSDFEASEGKFLVKSRNVQLPSKINLFKQEGIT